MVPARGGVTRAIIYHTLCLLYLILQKMKSKMILTIGLLAIVLGIATTGIAIKSVQAVIPDPEAIKTQRNRLLPMLSD